MKIPPPPPSGSLRHRLPIAALWAATLLSYASSFQAGLIFDNESRILKDPRIQAVSGANVSLIFQSDYWHPNLGSGIYRPLTTLSLLFNYAVLGNGGQPFGYHLVNWMLHALNASLVYFLALRLLKERTGAFAVAAIWAVHPVLTESITNIVGRADMLGGLGVLGGLLAYLEASESPGRARWRWLAAAAIVAGIGVFSKESAIVVLGVALLYDLWDRRKPFLPGYAALALPAAIYWVVRLQVFAKAVSMVVPFVDNPMARSEFLSAKLTAIKVLGKQWLLMAWPARLSSDYSYNEIPVSTAGDWKAWASLAFCVALAATAVILYRRKHPVSFWIALSFLTLAPTSNLAVMIGTPMAERFLYLPAIGFAGCVVGAISAACSGTKARTAHIVLTVLGVSLAARTFVRNLDWKDDQSLWASAVAASPNSYKTHMLLGTVDPALGLRETETAIAIVDSLPEEITTVTPFINGGKVHREEGDRLARTAPSEGAGSYQKALQYLLRADRIRRAHEERNRRQGTPANNAAIASPLYAPLYQELGRVYGRLSRPEDAVAAIRMASRFQQAPEVFEELAVAYFRKGDSQQAATALLEGILTNPRNQKLADEVASLYNQIDPGGCAVQTVNGRASLNLECASVHRDFCAASVNIAQLYRDSGQAAAADQTVRGAVQSMRCDSQLFH